MNTSIFSNPIKTKIGTGDVAMAIIAKKRSQETSLLIPDKRASPPPPPTTAFPGQFSSTAIVRYRFLNSVAHNDDNRPAPEIDRCKNSSKSETPLTKSSFRNRLPIKAPGEMRSAQNARLRPSCGGQLWPEPVNAAQDVGEHVLGNDNLGRLEGDIAPVANDLAANLDQFVPERRQRPVLDSVVAELAA
jgi:hypothetical protein